MTESEIKRRLGRVYAALEDKFSLKPEEVILVTRGTSDEDVFSIDFTGGRAPEHLEIDAFTVINEIMGIRDRAKSWIKSIGGKAREVDDFVRGNMAAALVHDLANTDKHGHLDKETYSGYRPVLAEVGRGLSLVYNPTSGTYCELGEVSGPVIDLWESKVLEWTATSSGVEIVLTGRVQSETGDELAKLQKLIPDAIYQWEQFLVSKGLTLT